MNKIKRNTIMASIILMLSLTGIVGTYNLDLNTNANPALIISLAFFIAMIGYLIYLYKEKKKLKQERESRKEK